MRIAIYVIGLLSVGILLTPFYPADEHDNRESTSLESTPNVQEVIDQESISNGGTEPATLDAEKTSTDSNQIQVSESPVEIGDLDIDETVFIDIAEPEEQLFSVDLSDESTEAVEQSVNAESPESDAQPEEQQTSPSVERLQTERQAKEQDESVTEQET